MKLTAEVKEKITDLLMSSAFSDLMYEEVCTGEDEKADEDLVEWVVGELCECIQKGGESHGQVQL